MTGLFPQQHGVIALSQKEFTDFRAGGSKASWTLASHMSKLGYHTAAYGKSHLGDQTSYGFKEGKESGPHDDRETFALAEAFLSRQAKTDEPFFLWLAPKQPHVPLLPEQEWLELYDPSKLTLPTNFRESPLSQSIFNQGLPGEHFYRDSGYRRNLDKLPSGPPRDRDLMRRYLQVYYAVVSHLDHQIGQFVKQLHDNELFENTIIFYVSDNGYHLGSHGLGNKITMHEESVRVPMFVTGPGLVKTARTNSLVSTVDLFPTLLELAGATNIPEHLMGKSLVPVLKNPTRSVHDVVFSECVGVDGRPGQGHRMARSETHKYVLTGIDEEYLFDLRANPSETVNCVDEPSERATFERLRTKLAEWMKSIGDRPISAAQTGPDE